MGSVAVALDKRNPTHYIVAIENNEGNRLVFGVNDQEFDDFIMNLQAQRKLAQMERKRNYDKITEKYR